MREFSIRTITTRVGTRKDLVARHCHPRSAKKPKEFREPGVNPAVFRRNPANKPLLASTKFGFWGLSRGYRSPPGFCACLAPPNPNGVGWKLPTASTRASPWIASSNPTAQ